MFLSDAKEESESPPTYDESVGTLHPAPPGTYINGRFPLSCNFYFKHTWKLIAFVIGEQKDSPLYSVTMPSGWYGDLVLRNGPGLKATPLVTATDSGKWGKKSKITVHEMPSIGRKEVHEILQFSGGLSHETYLFSTHVGHDPKSLVHERFEWRRSHGEEVRSLQKMKWGWKLVRLDGSVTAPTVPGRSRDVGRTSDGKEVVAVWGHFNKLSATKIGEFQFVGSGATGELGELFPVMAISTYARLHQMSCAGASS